MLANPIHYPSIITATAVAWFLGWLPMIPMAAGQSTTIESPAQSSPMSTAVDSTPAETVKREADELRSDLPGQPKASQTKNADAANERKDATSSATGFTRVDAILAALTIFVLAIFVGFELITKVPPTLHTPLMSGSNAISGITIVGAILMAGGSGWTAFFGMLAVVLAAINVVGGFLVTDRMLGMFRR